MKMPNSAYIACIVPSGGSLCALARIASLSSATVSFVAQGPLVTDDGRGAPLSKAHLTGLRCSQNAHATLQAIEPW